MKTVLLIEDDALVRETLQDLLEGQNFQVLTAENGETGVQLAHTHLPDIVLCDVQMPGMDGYAVLRSLHQQEATSTIPFIFLTGQANQSAVRQGMNLGADDYLTKPCTLEDLLKAINSRLNKQEVLLSHAQQQLDSLRSSIALSLPHELRTPLTSIITSVELLRAIADNPSSADVLDIADTIQSSAHKLHRLIQKFLLYVKLEIAARDPHHSSFEAGVTQHPGPIIKTVATQIAQRAQRLPDLELNLQSTAIAFSNSDLERILTELVENAFKFSSDSMPVRINSFVEAGHFQLEIINAGRGFKPEQLAHLGAYLQFDRKTYEQQGVGLGLAIAKRLVELQGGNLSIQSQPNQPTTVHVTLPLADAAIAQDWITQLEEE